MTGTRVTEIRPNGRGLPNAFGVRSRIRTTNNGKRRGEARTQLGKRIASLGGRR